MMAPIKQKSTTMRPTKSKNQAEDVKFSGVSIGETLRKAREERGISLDAIANELMIRRFYLESLEQGSFKDLPERVYATGFVKNYASYIGLDVHSTVEQFKREAYGSRNVNNYQVDLNMPEPVVHSVVPGRSAIISAVVILFAVIISIIVFAQSGKKPAADIPAPVAAPAPEVEAEEAVATPVETPAATPEAAAPAEEFTRSAAATATPAAAEQKPVVPAAVTNRRVIEALQSSWVEIKDDKGKVLFTSILKQGQLLPLPENTKVGLTTGNAGGLRLILDGQPQAAFGQVNEVKRNIPLEIPAAPVAPAAATGDVPAEASVAAPAPAATLDQR